MLKYMTIRGGEKRKEKKKEERRKNDMRNEPKSGALSAPKQAGPACHAKAALRGVI